MSYGAVDFSNALEVFRKSMMSIFEVNSIIFLSDLDCLVPLSTRLVQFAK
jgi:hypothetical protein